VSLVKGGVCGVQVPEDAGRRQRGGAVGGG
jgi:hypothetical protein